MTTISTADIKGRTFNEGICVPSEATLQLPAGRP